MLTDYPVKFTDPAVRATLSILQTIYRQPEIESIVQDAGLPVYEVAFHTRADLTWRSVFELAAGQLRVPELFDVVVGRYPGLKLRLDELSADEPVRDAGASVPLAQQDPESAAWKNFSVDGSAEAVIVAGQPTFVDVAFLELGLRRASSVCRMVCRFPDGRGSGTGFRVGKRHLLTNHHVLFDHDNNAAQATSVSAWFNYEDDIDGNPKKHIEIRCDPASIVGELHDDWALVTASQPIPAQFPVLPIQGALIPVVDDRVYIIQHPGGGPKQVAFQHNLVRDVSDDVLQYWTDTDLGSSGSPVFDEHWKVVGLHHFSVRAPEEDRVGVRNQGRRIDVVTSRIEALGVLPELK